jgi:hypothetical protein
LIVQVILRSVQDNEISSERVEHFLSGAVVQNCTVLRDDRVTLGVFFYFCRYFH